MRGTLQASRQTVQRDHADAEEEVYEEDDNPYRGALFAALRGVDIDARVAPADGTDPHMLKFHVAPPREDVAAAAATLLATLLRSRYIDEGALEAGGALPARRRRTKVRVRNEC